MFIEAIDKLRCVKAHEDSWLVAKFVEMRDRDFWEGELGCPVCEARYPVQGGVVYFSPIRAKNNSDSFQSAGMPEELFALAAMLDLSAPERTIVLCDEWCGFAPSLSDISEPHIFTINSQLSAAPSECVYPVVSESAIPLGKESVDAVALAAAAAGSMVKSAVEVLKEGGRLIGKTGTSVPSGVVLLASDDHNWVAQKQGAFIPLRRASR